MEESRKKAEVEVGAMSFKALKFAAKLVKPGTKLLDVALAAESYAKENGYDLAFPINLSSNNMAAHYSPAFDDQTEIGEKDLIKVDFGVAKNGILGDCAVTIDVGSSNGKLVEAAEAALQNAISIVRPGVSVSRVGAEIAETISRYGFKPIKNLGGHGIGVHDLHADFFIPNYDNGDQTLLEEDMTIAIEPFATNGKGLVTEADICEIYSFIGEAQVRSQSARALMSKITSAYPSEPFAVRWLAGPDPNRFELYTAIQELVRNGVLEPHPTLIEVGRGNVSQAEAKLLVTSNGCEILTK
ncbi:MAG: type II methionyl aminopeptidase [Candidatus Micrarchaeaceae archaeon]